MGEISVKSVVDGLMEPLLAEGFRQRHRTGFFWQASDEAYGFLNLQTSSSFGFIDVIPEVGIRHERLMRTISDFGLIAREVFVTVGYPLLMRQQLHNVASIVKGRSVRCRSSWSFTTKEHIKNKSPSFRDAVRDLAIPFVAQRSRLRSIADVLRMETKDGGDEIDMSHLAVALYLLGEHDDIPALLSRHIAATEESAREHSGIRDRLAAFKTLASVLCPKLDGLSARAKRDLDGLRALLKPVSRKAPTKLKPPPPPKAVAPTATVAKIPRLRTFLPPLMAPLIEDGFQWLDRAPHWDGKRPGGLYWKRTNPEIIIYIALNGRDAGSVMLGAEIEPMLGVIHEPLRALKRQLREEKAPARGDLDLASASIWMSPSTLPGIDYKKLKLEPLNGYVFNSAADVARVGATVKSFVALAVLPFFRRFQTLHDLTDCMESMEGGQDDECDYDVPVALHMMGRHGDAYRCLQRYQQKLMISEWPDSDFMERARKRDLEAYQRFSDRLIALMQKSGWSPPK